MCSQRYVAQQVVLQEWVWAGGDSYFTHKQALAENVTLHRLVF